MNEYFSIDELSKYLGIKKSTLYFKVEIGQIPHYKIGRLIRFKKSDIDSWMESLRQTLSIPDGKTREIKKVLKNRRSIDIDSITRKVIAEVKAKEYNSGMGNQA